MADDKADGILSLKKNPLTSILAALNGRKGILAAVGIGIAYYVLLGKLPDNTAPQIVTERTEQLMGFMKWIIGFYITGTAVEDGMKHIANGKNGGGT